MRFILFVGALLLTSISVGKAQDKLQIMGDSRFEPGELVSNTIRDSNGRVAAGIKILTDLTGLSIEANNGVLKVNQNIGSYYVFLSPDERVLTIRKSGYAELKVILPEIGIRLKSGQTWVINLTGDSKIIDELSDLIAIKKQQEEDEQRRFDAENRTRIVAIEKQSELLALEKLKLQNQVEERIANEKRKEEALKRYEEENNISSTDKTLLTLNQTLSKWKELNTRGLRRQQSLDSLRLKTKQMSIDDKPKDEFETQVQYEERVLLNKKVISKINSEYDSLINLAWQPIKEEMRELSKLQFSPSRVSINLGPYNAEVGAFNFISVKAITHIGTLLDYRSSAIIEPEIARVFRQFESTLIHNIYLYVDVQGDFKLNTDIILKEPLNLDTLALKLYQPELNSVNMEFVFIPVGDFLMGAGEVANEMPVHKVKLTKPFEMGKYEVTQKQWISLMGSNPSNVIGDNLPVTNVSWDEVQVFISKLNKIENTSIYRLPTEAEWEYACRAGTSTKWPFGDNESNLKDYTHYVANSSFGIKEVGQKKPNQFGLYDMLGNAWEWVNDWYKLYSSGETTNPKSPSIGNEKVRRGGSWSYKPIDLTPSLRDKKPTEHKDNFQGFRIVRDL